LARTRARAAPVELRLQGVPTTDRGISVPRRDVRSFPDHKT
jgi:hypothetical protein